MREKRGIIVWGLNFAFGVGIRESEGDADSGMVWVSVTFPLFQVFFTLIVIEG